MLSRRTTLGFMTAVSASLVAQARAATAGEAASALIKTATDKLAAVVNGTGAIDARRQALTPIIDSVVDIAGVARFCLGRFWRTATPDQQKQYVSLFHGVLVNNIAVKLGDYRGVKVTIGRTRIATMGSWCRR